MTARVLVDNKGRTRRAPFNLTRPGLAPDALPLQVTASSEDLMRLERLPTPSCAAPFPIHQDLVARMLAAHAPNADERDPVVAHVLATCAGYAYAGTATVATMMARVGLMEGACVRIAQVVSAMRIVSTAYLVQSRCGRVVVLCYRGTEGDNIDNWLTDVDVDPETITLGGAPVQVHSGFYRNIRVTRSDVLEVLAHGLAGRSLLEPSRRVEHPLEALYVTGHSLGGAMAVLFALSVADTPEDRAIAKRLRAVYTYGQPIATMEPLGVVARQVGRMLFRHVLVRDIVPALPPARWGSFAHIGREYRWVDGSWKKSDAPVAPLENVREIPRAFSLLVAPAKQRKSAHYTVREHGPHHYIAALRPRDRVTEYGDRV